MWSVSVDLMAIVGVVQSGHSASFRGHLFVDIIDCIGASPLEPASCASSDHCVETSTLLRLSEGEVSLSQSSYESRHGHEQKSREVSTWTGDENRGLAPPEENSGQTNPDVENVAPEKDGKSPLCPNLCHARTTW